MAEIKMEALKPNSHKYNEAAIKNPEPVTAREGREKLSSVVGKDRLVSTKKPLGQKIAAFLNMTDIGDLKKYVWKDILIPGLKNAFLDTLSMLFFHEPISRSSKYDSAGKKAYNLAYRGIQSSVSSPRYHYAKERETSHYENDRVDYRHIVLKYREDTEEVIDKLRDRVDVYGYATVADLLELCGLSSNYTDNNWGWKDVRDLGIRKVQGGWLIDVNEAKYIDV